MFTFVGESKHNLIEVGYVSIDEMYLEYKNT